MTSEQCAICLNALNLGDVGTFVPCGHCVHVECFKEYLVSYQSRTRANSDGRDEASSFPSTSMSPSSCFTNPLPRCPICLSDTLHFQRIYLQRECKEGEQGGSDFAPKQHQEGNNELRLRSNGPPLHCHQDETLLQRDLTPPCVSSSAPLTMRVKKCTSNQDNSPPPFAAAGAPRETVPRVLCQHDPRSHEEDKNDHSNRRENQGERTTYSAAVNTTTTAGASQQLKFPSPLCGFIHMANVQYQTMLAQREINILQAYIGDLNNDTLERLGETTENKRRRRM